MLRFKTSSLWCLVLLTSLSCASEQQQGVQDGGNSANSANASNAEDGGVGNSEDAPQEGGSNSQANSSTGEEEGGGNAAKNGAKGKNKAGAGENINNATEDSGDASETPGNAAGANAAGNAAGGDLLSEVADDAPEDAELIPENPATAPANAAVATATPSNSAPSSGEGTQANTGMQVVGDQAAQDVAAQQAGGQGGAAPLGSEAAAADVSDVRPTSNGMLSWVGYKFDRKDKQLKLEVITRGRPQYEVFLEKNKAQQPELVVRFFETALRPRIRRDIDASEFKSPVSFVRMREDTGNRTTDVVITTRDPIKPRLFAKDGNLLLTYDIPNKYFGTSDEIRAEVVGNAVPLAALMPDLESGAEAPSRIAKGDVLVAFPDPTKGALSGASGQDQSVDEAIGTEQKADAKGLPGNFGVEEELAPLEESTPAIDSDSQEYEFKPDGAYLMPMDGLKLVIVRALSVGAVASAGLAEPAQAASWCRTHVCVAQIDALTPPTENAGGEQQQSFGAPVEPGKAPATGDLEGQEQEQGGEAKTFSGRPIAIEFFATPLREVLNVIQAESGNNFVFKEAVGQTQVTIKLRNVPWDEALNAILETYGLGMARVGPNIIRVDSLKELVSSLEQINQSKKVEALSAPSKIMTVRLSHAKAGTVAGTVGSILNAAIQAANQEFSGGKGAGNVSVLADDRTNSLVVQAPVTFLARARALIERLDIETPQIEISSRIVEVSRQGNDFFGFSFSTGLNFDAGRALSFGSINFPNSFRSGFAVDPSVSATSANSTTSFTFGSINNFINLDAILKMEEKRGTTNILQSSRVVVLDRQKANITSGSSQYFRKTAETTASTTGTQTASGGSGIDKVDFNLSLDVTPEVAADGLITMQVAVATSNPTPPNAGQATAASSRSVQTRMALRSSDTAVIGGIYDTKKITSLSGIPYLMDIPIIGTLFRSTANSESQVELLIFLTPTLVNPGSQKAQPTDFEKDAAVSSPVASNAALNKEPGDVEGGDVSDSGEESNTPTNAAPANNAATKKNGSSSNVAPSNSAPSNAAPANNAGGSGKGQDNTFDDSANAPDEGTADESI